MDTLQRAGRVGRPFKDPAQKRRERICVSLPEATIKSIDHIANAVSKRAGKEYSRGDIIRDVVALYMEMEGDKMNDCV